jgi:hypothetical protein
MTGGGMTYEIFPYKPGLVFIHLMKNDDFVSYFREWFQKSFEKDYDF